MPETIWDESGYPIGEVSDKKNSADPLVVSDCESRGKQSGQQGLPGPELKTKLGAILPHWATQE
jgi:hypothetical protein